MQAIVLAGGLATRLESLRPQVPKFLIPVAGKPFGDRILATLVRAGFSDVVLCIGHQGELIEEHFSVRPFPDLKISYSYDGAHPLGTGGALINALPMLESRFFVLYGDSYLRLEYSKIFDFFLRLPEDILGLMTVFNNDNTLDRSNVEFKDGRLICYNKNSQTPEMHHIEYGACILKREVLEALPAGVNIDLATVYTSLVSQGQMVGYEVFERFYEIGTPGSLQEANQYFALNSEL